MGNEGREGKGGDGDELSETWNLRTKAYGNVPGRTGYGSADMIGGKSSNGRQTGNLETI